MQPRLEQFVKKRWPIHILLWVISFYLLLHHFAMRTKPDHIDYIFTILFHISLVFTVYTNLFLLVPQFFQKRKYAWYFLLAFILIALGAGFNLFTFNTLSDFLFPGYYLVPIYDFLEACEFMGGYLLVSTLLKLSGAWFKVQKQEKQLLKLEKEKLALELKALKMQVQPHFLFNSLNSLYSLAQEKDDRAGDYIVKLADILRYSLYQSKDDLVPLDIEIQQLKNYLELQKLRMETHESIKSSILLKNSKEHFIPPLLLITLVENAFKHGKLPDGEKEFIDIKITSNLDQINFWMKNPLKTLGGKNIKSGLGLDNTRRRLNLLFPGNHKLKAGRINNHFETELEIGFSN